MDKEDKIIKKLENHDKRLDRISKKLLEHDDSLREIKETMATKSDINRVMNSLDEVLTITRRLDQERIFTQEWIRRIEKEVSDHTKELTKVKRTLKIA